jgi:hypothetical protein
VSQVLNKSSVAILFGEISSTATDPETNSNESNRKMKNRNTKRKKHDQEAQVALQTKEISPKTQEEAVVKNKDDVESFEWKKELNARNPLFVLPDKGWEMEFLTRHFHPSVSMFASNIRNSPEDKLEYDGDPLEDFSLKHFLDRFVHRTPKKLEKKDILLAKQASLFGRKTRIEQSRKNTYESLSNRQLIHLSEDKIPIEERFIYKFLKSRNFSSVEDDIESVTSNEFEEFMDRFEHEFETDDLGADDLEADDLEADDLDADELETDDLEADDFDSDEFDSDEFDSDDFETDDFETDYSDTDVKKGSNLKRKREKDDV